MKPIYCNVKEHFAIQDSKWVHAKTKRIKKMLDAKYKKVNLAELIPSLKHLNKLKQEKFISFYRNTSPLVNYVLLRTCY